jgi:hypothetical protein
MEMETETVTEPVKPDFIALEKAVVAPHADPGLAERLKDAMYYCMNVRDDGLACRAAQLYKTAVQQHKEQRPGLYGDAALLGCLSFQQGMPAAGLLLGNVLVSGLYLTGSTEEDRPVRRKVFAALQSVLDMAARKRCNDVFLTLLGQLRGYARTRHPEAGNGYAALLLDLLFVAADRRQLPALGIVTRLAGRLWRDTEEGAEARSQFAREWSSTVAQIAHRGWLAETHLLEEGLCRMAWRTHDFSLQKALLADAAFQVQMISHWDGCEKAFQLYRPLFGAALAWERKNVRPALGAANPPADCLRNLTALFAAFRDMAATTARVTMQDEWQVYTAWNKAWLAAAEGKPARQEQICIFMQLLIQFWGLSQPRRAKRQWPKLEGVLTPRKVSGAAWAVLLNSLV